MSGKIFINYRRGDDPGFTQALFQRIEEAFKSENLFMDVEGHIKPGEAVASIIDYSMLLTAQVKGLAVVAIWSSLGSFLLWKIADLVLGLRPAAAASAATG